MTNRYWTEKKSGTIKHETLTSNLFYNRATACTKCKWWSNPIAMIHLSLSCLPLLLSASPLYAERRVHAERIVTSAHKVGRTSYRCRSRSCGRRVLVQAEKDKPSLPKAGAASLSRARSSMPRVSVLEIAIHPSLLDQQLLMHKLIKQIFLHPLMTPVGHRVYVLVGRIFLSFGPKN